MNAWNQQFQAVLDSLFEKCCRASERTRRLRRPCCALNMRRYHATLARIVRACEVQNSKHLLCDSSRKKRRRGGRKKERDFLITMREHPEGIGMGEEDISVGTLTPPVNPAESEGAERAAEGPDAPPTKTSCNPPEPVALAWARSHGCKYRHRREAQVKVVHAEE